MSNEFDVVIVGGGLAGLVAGNRAAQLGRSVAVLEKGTEELYPCNSRFAFGAFHICRNDMMAPPDTPLTPMRMTAVPERDVRAQLSALGAEVPRTEASEGGGVRTIRYFAARAPVER